MYNIYYETDNGNMPVINIEGRLDTVDDIARIIAEVHSINRDNNRSNKENGKNVVINLSKADFIAEDCLRMFKRLKPVYNLEFQNYSLYIELQLKENDLIGSEEGENKEKA